MKNAAFPDQIGGCEKSMHYPDDPKDCFASLAMTRSHLWGVATILANTYQVKKRGHAPPLGTRSEFACLTPRGRALCALRSVFILPPNYWGDTRIPFFGNAPLTMFAKFLGSAPNSGRGILPRRSGWKPLPLFRWIPTELFKAGIETWI